MFEKKCSSCAEKVDRKFRYCPWCGSSFRSSDEKENFGMLGTDDTVQEIQKEMQKGMNLPGLDKVMSNLMKQLETEMQKQGNTGPMPRGFNIQISTGMPGMNMNQVQGKQNSKPKKEIISEAAPIERYKGNEVFAFRSSKASMIRSITLEAASPDVSGRITANSSPPNRQQTSSSRSVSFISSAASRRI